MSNKIIFIIWASWSWKSTVETQFMENEAKKYWGFNHIVSHATRKARIRDWEKDWVDYYFISEEEFDIIDTYNWFIQKIGHAGSRKWSSKKEWKEKLKLWNVIMPVLLNSAIQLKKNLVKINPKLLNNISIIFFDISKEEALKRMLWRYAQEFNITANELSNRYNAYKEWKETVKRLKNTFQEIDLRLNDIELLEQTKEIANYTIKINKPRTKEDIYSEFLNIVKDIFK